MHDGCNGAVGDGIAVVDKVRMMGFNKQMMPAPLDMVCSNCEAEFKMTHFEGKCPECNMVFGVTPCHAFDASHVKAAGIDY